MITYIGLSLPIKLKRKNAMLMKKVVVVGCLFLAGCAPMVAKQPIVYGTVEGRDKDFDIFDCGRFAEKATTTDPSIGEGAVAGGVGGAVLGAAIGAIAGAFLGGAGTGAALGASLGGVSGAAGGAGTNATEIARRKQEATLLCLKSRGYEYAAY